VLESSADFGAACEAISNALESGACSPRDDELVDTTLGSQTLAPIMTPLRSTRRPGQCRLP